MQEDEQRARLLEESIGRCGAGPCGGYGARGGWGGPTLGPGWGGARGGSCAGGSREGPCSLRRGCGRPGWARRGWGLPGGTPSSNHAAERVPEPGRTGVAAAFSLGPSWRQPIG